MTERRAIALLVLLHFAMVAIVQPRGDFPVNDDWAFAQTVRWLLDEGRFRLSDWVPMDLVPQAYAGAAVATIWGFSFEALRHLTQAVALATLVAAYGWFRVAGLDAWSSFVASVVLAAFPAWPVLANSFMTDLYALAFALPAAALFAGTLRDGRMATWVPATLVTVAGVLERQVVLAIPFAFLVAWLWTRRWTFRAWVVAAVPLVLAIVAAFAFQAYLEAGPGVPEMQRMAHGRVVKMAMGVATNEPGLVRWAAGNLATIFGYLGLFTAGWIAWWGVRAEPPARRALVLGGAFVVMALSLAGGWLPPYRPDQVMDAAGIGPLMLYDAVRHRSPLDRSAGSIWPVAAVAASFGLSAVTVAIATCAKRAIRSRRDADPLTVFLLALLAAYLGPFVVTDYFDRYLVFILPFVIVLVTRAWPVQPEGTALRRLGVAWIVAALFLGAAATRDYFSWNRARWDAIHLAEKLGGDASSIDGGFEYGGLARYEKRADHGTEGKSWYWVKDDAFVVAFSKVDGYDEVETWSVPHWLSRSPAEVKLLRRKP
jgi:hypothetical protein